MGILMDKNTRVLVQGITGRIGSVQTKWMLEYNTNVVAGVTPGKGGSEVHGVPVFDTVEEAVKNTGANASVFFVPSFFVLDAFYETVEAGIKFVVVVPEHIPVHDMVKMKELAKRAGVVALGPTTPGILVPGVGKMGIMPASLFRKGKVAIVSRSGTLSYEFAGILSDHGAGQSVVVGMGADPVVLMNLTEIIELFQKDEHTEGIIIVGEVGGAQEELAAHYIKEHVDKPISAYIAGKLSPPGKRMGHAGAIVRGSSGTVEGKYQALRDAGVDILDSPIEAGAWVRRHGLMG
ncbi:MAG TPA: succinate--CoA ligase subunit alpha [Desulfobacterales bacterium]|nr:succinate--CoA ligase subunit alpha [Desulfobacterales bacterium]